MVFDHFDNRRMYAGNDVWEQAFDFLSSLNADADACRYPLRGDAMFASVESYETRRPGSTLPEAHRRYVDIQMVLSGAERVGWWPVGALSILKPYNPERDIAFYDRPRSMEAKITLKAGRFAIFYPQDAHMPGLRIGSTVSRVKKVVVKISLELI